MIFVSILVLGIIIGYFVSYKKFKKKKGICYYAELLADKDIRKTFYGGD